MGLSNGLDFAFEGLDRMVQEDPSLRNVEIRSVEDKYFIIAGKEHRNAQPMHEECLSRVIIYRPIK